MRVSAITHRHQLTGVHQSDDGHLPKFLMYFGFVETSPGPLNRPINSPARSRKLGCLPAGGAPKCCSKASRTSTLLGM